ncbi:hypothetical protein [Paraglaciecola aestuariivivens]
MSKEVRVARMFYKSLSLIGLSLISIFALASQSAKLKWGYVNFAPYHYSENGQVLGTIAEKVEHIFSQTGLSYSAYELPNKRTKLYIEQGKVDFTIVIDSFISTPEQFLKSQKPVYFIVLGAICNQDAWQIQTLDDLKARELILISGYTYGQQQALSKELGYTINMQAKNHADAIKALTYNRGECVLGYQAPFTVEEVKYPNDNFYFYQLNALPVYLYLNKNVQDSSAIMQIINQYNL